MKIAIVHDWLTTYAGAERVLEQMIKIFPAADLYSIVDFVPDKQRDFLQSKKISTSFIQYMPFAKSKYRSYLPIMPLAIEQFDMARYDLIISSSHAIAKGILTGPDQLHLCMCYSPIRYAWDLQHQYLKESGLDKGIKGWTAKWILHKMRLWDYRTANGVDGFIAISNFIAKRIWKCYRRHSTVIYPPVDVAAFDLCTQKDEYYLTASRMVPYKKIDLIVRAFREMPEKKLVVIGDGPDYKKIRAVAGENVELLGYQSFDKMKRYMQHARAFIFAAEEDFGIVPLEAQACGTPVIAFGKGGALETICGLDNPRPTGVFFEEQTVPSLVQAVCQFEKERILPQACHDNALRFAPGRFQQEFKTYVNKQLEIFRKNSFMEDTFL
ncbi:glycosyltransferase family 4 protein [Sporomusa acidovorans]|uniref:GDP-mannose-dependent alpha-(1-6)-phosphatidylinositol monomannoside mannosyltransferase n=1 Tax=Sporomusa acidovorans (strain ATCC 49682 / DSM 3132 / Mol) TaxID=1123286 RepID=A0ABZ3J7R7_SPOA4|nr:glycosyltransferase family 4 protein [Sporomusa acidovorans]OZC19349.1 GDP-mannose-dependent alpha-(1-6)-phosphatidylinositol monomannoside mannosyltransferase [Sporomusa acidovorans DSM 3132]SDD79893.1 Glycosyltransferase involved in cell wall bisynthesis [Sporomusa acidovorans]